MGKEAGESLERMTTYLGFFGFGSLPRSLQRERGETMLSRSGRGVEERSGVRGRVARGGGFYSCGKEQ
jgi:hypothetical protein